MKWKIISTKTFSQEFKKYKRDKEFVKTLNKKIKRLQENSEIIGGYLSGKLHGYKSTRIVKNFKLIFKITYNKKEVFLSAIDHKKFDYKRFDLE